jgi:hypothetical protein
VGEEMKRFCCLGLCLLWSASSAWAQQTCIVDFQDKSVLETLGDRSREPNVLGSDWFCRADQVFWRFGTYSQYCSGRFFSVRDFGEPNLEQGDRLDPTQIPPLSADPIYTITMLE